MPTHDLAAAGQFEPFGSSLMSLELGFSFRDLGQNYPPEDSCEPAGLACGGKGALGWLGAGRGDAVAVLPAAFLGARMVVKFGPSSRGRASTWPFSPIS